MKDDEHIFKDAITTLRKEMDACIKEPHEYQVSGEGGFWLDSGKKFNPAVVSRVFEKHLLNFTKQAMHELEDFYSHVDEQKTLDQMHPDDQKNHQNGGKISSLEGKYNILKCSPSSRFL